MLQSLLALPLGAAAEVLLFLALYRLSPLSGRQAAVVVALLSLTAVLLYSLLNWPGADVLAMYVAVLSVTAYLLAIVSHAREQHSSEAAGRRRWFHWGPAAIVIFFVALFALDGVLVTISTQGLPRSVSDWLLPRSYQEEHIQSVFPGTVANDFQKKETLYNQYLEQVREQHQRGWKVDKGWLHKPVEGRPAAFQVRVREADGAPVQFAEISGVFQRASDSREDASFDMREIEPGLYRVVLTLPEPGMWYLVLKVKRGEQLHELHASTSVAARGD
ncbi:MAG: FixH family protein [Thiogranum sp.]